MHFLPVLNKSASMMNSKLAQRYDKYIYRKLQNTTLKLNNSKQSNNSSLAYVIR